MKARRAQNNEFAMVHFRRIMASCQESVAEDDEPLPPKKRIRTKQKIQFMTRNEQGILVPMNPKGTSWYLLYVESPMLDCPKFLHKFRLRFRLPCDGPVGDCQNKKR